MLYTGRSEDDAVTLCRTVTQHTSAVNRMRRHCYRHHHQSILENRAMLQRRMQTTRCSRCNQLIVQHKSKVTDQSVQTLVGIVAAVVNAICNA